jgi:hypothetical protein
MMLRSMPIDSLKHSVGNFERFVEFRLHLHGVGLKLWQVFVVFAVNIGACLLVLCATLVFGILGQSMFDNVPLLDTLLDVLDLMIVLAFSLSAAVSIRGMLRR